MQLSAPASFPEMLAPASGGELLSDGAPATEGGDFAALVEGLADPASSARQPAEPASATPGRSDELPLLAAFAAFVPTLPLAPVAPANPGLGLPGALDGEAGDLPATTDSAEGGEAAWMAAAVGQGRSSGRGLGLMDARTLARSLPVSSGDAAMSETPAAPLAPAFAKTAGPALPAAATAMPGKDGIAVLPAPAAPVAAAVAAAQAPASAQAQVATAVALAGEATPDAGIATPGRGRRGEAGGAEAPPTVPAKFAADAISKANAMAPTKMAVDKNFLSVDSKIVTESDDDVGTDVAFTAPSMTSSAPTSPSTAFVPPVSGMKDGVVDASALARFDAKAEVPEQVERLAHRAVEAVAATVERGAAQPAHSVNLKFSVQGADLLVRVALRAEEIQVTFRTDSSDLRTALAHEWQMVRSRDPEGALQSITPVFTASDSGTSTSSQGGREGANPFAQLQAQADAHSQRQAARQFNEAPAPFAGGAAGSSASTAATAPRVPATDSSVSSRLLHTFA